MSAALELRGVSAWYGDARIISDASLNVAAGEVVALIGRNGAGKTSLLRAAIGLMPRSTGSVVAQRASTSAGCRRSAARSVGLGYVPEDRRIFTDLTVEENLRIASRPLAGGLTEHDLLALFPNLADMLQRPASAMSGGEQQMLAVARTLAANPSRRITRRAVRRHCTVGCREDARSGPGNEGARRRNTRFRAERTLCCGDCRSRGAYRTGQGGGRSNAGGIIDAERAGAARAGARKRLHLQSSDDHHRRCWTRICTSSR